IDHAVITQQSEARAVVAGGKGDRLVRPAQAEDWIWREAVTVGAGILRRDRRAEADRYDVLGRGGARGEEGKGGGADQRGRAERERLLRHEARTAFPENRCGDGTKKPL